MKFTERFVRQKVNSWNVEYADYQVTLKYACNYIKPGVIISYIFRGWIIRLLISRLEPHNGVRIFACYIILLNIIPVVRF